MYAERQQLKWLAHCGLMEDNALQKTTLFMNPTNKNYQSIWNRVGTKSGLDRQKFWQLALDKKSFNSYVGERYGNLNGESPEWGSRMYVFNCFSRCMGTWFQVIQMGWLKRDQILCHQGRHQGRGGRDLLLIHSHIHNVFIQLLFENLHSSPWLQTSETGNLLVCLPSSHWQGRIACKLIDT